MQKNLLVLLSLFFAIAAHSQKQVKLSGKVTDASDGSVIVGATVTVEGGRSTRTDVEGHFFVGVEPSKTYSIQVSNIGYKKKIVTDVKAAEDAATLAISLEREDKNLESVTVKSSGKKESTATLYATQKNSSSISDGIASEVIRRSPDRNTGEVLRRVSGTSIQDNKFVVIRGLNERYNAALLNNSMLPSTEPDKRAFSFDIIPASLIDNVTIYKSPMPDLPADFAGGTVKISTKDYPSKKQGELSFSLGYNTNTTFQNFYKGFPEGKLDWLGFMDQSRLIPGAYYQYRGAAYSNLDDKTKTAITKRFPNNFGMQAASQSHPNFSISYTGGDTKLLKKNKLGYIYSVSYSNGRKMVDRNRDEYETYGFHNYQYNTEAYEMKSGLSALFNLSYSYGKNKISLKNLFNNDFTGAFSSRAGAVMVNPTDVIKFKSQNTEVSQNGLVNSVAEGLHSMGKWSIDWNGSFSTTYRWQPDQHYLTFVTNPNSNDYFLKLNNQNSPVITDAGRIYSFLNENIYGANVNVTRQFNWKGKSQKLKFGTANYYRSRQVEVDALGLASTSFLGARIPETKNTTFENIMSPNNIDQYGIIYANIPANSTDYSGTALLNAGYVMLDNKLSDRFKLTWGVRAEKYLQELSAKGKQKISLDNTDVLPSMLVTYSVNRSANLRLAASQGVNRPEFRELATYRVYDYENNFIIQGNNNLVRSRNTNVDARYEWFPGAGEIISVSGFYKYFKNPIEQTNLGNDVLSFANADNATVYGVEFELRKKLNFFNSTLMDHLTFYTNAAYIKGNVNFGGQSVNSPLQGQSPYLINGGLTYSSDNDQFSFNLLYNRVGERLKFRAATSAGRNIFEKPRDVMDMQVSKKWMGSRIETKLTVSDVFAQPFAWYYKYDANPSKTSYDASTDRILNTYKYGTTFTLSVKYNIAK